MLMQSLASFYITANAIEFRIPRALVACGRYLHIYPRSTFEVLFSADSDNLFQSTVGC